MTAEFMAKFIESYYGIGVSSKAPFMKFLKISESGFNFAWQQGVKDSKKVVDMDIDKIHILPCFSVNPPKPEKMQDKERYYQETGLLQSEIILDWAGNLIDGYTSYLLAKAHGLASVPVRYGRRQIIT